MPIAVKTPKHPSEVETYRHLWEQALLVDGVDVGDTITGGTVEVLSGDMVLTDTSVTGITSYYTLAGGTKDTWLRLTVTTSQGRTLVDDIMVSISKAQ